MDVLPRIDWPIYCSRFNCHNDLVWGFSFADKELAGVFIAAFILVVFPLSEALLPVSNAVEKFLNLKSH